MKKQTIKITICLLIFTQTLNAQRNETKANDSNTPLHLLKPDYPVPYGKVEIESLTKILNYLLIDR